VTKRLTVSLAVALLIFVCACGAFAQIKPQLLAPGEAPDGSPVAKYGWLQAKEGFLRGSKSGATTNVQLKGMSFGWSNGGDSKAFYNENVVAWMAHDWQVDVLRAAMGTKKDEGGGNPGYCENDAVGQAALVKVVVEAAIMRGIYIIIDFHSHYADQYTSCAQTFFKDMVALYGKYPNVIYEIYNEPKTGWDAVKPYSNTLISTIRSAESAAGVTNANLIVIGNPGWSSQPNVGSNNDISDSKSNIAYTLHFYSAAGAHDGYRANATGAKNMGRTVFVTEFGTCNSDGNAPLNTSNADTWFTGTLDPNKISWVNWQINNRDEASSILKPTVVGTSGNWTSASYSTAGTYIRGKFPGSSNRSYSVTLTQPAAGGTISKEPASATHAYNSEIKIKSAPAAGWELMRWTGDAAGGDATLTGLITGLNLKIGAEFYNGGLVTNGHFTYTVASWSSNNSSSLAISQDNGQLKAAISAAGSVVSDLRVTQGGIKLEKGRSYTLKFSARGQSARSITPRITNSVSTRDYMGNTPEALTTTMKTITRTFVSDTTIANAVLRFDCGGEAAAWYIDDVQLLEGSLSPVKSRKNVAQRTVWSVVGSGGGAVLRGPAETGATLSLYDVRGKTVRSFAAKDGLTLGAGIPVGNYIAVVRNASGQEVYRAKMPVTR